MADVYKIVNSTELDSGLTSVANAIREKGEIVGTLLFPEGFVQAIAEMSSSNVYTEAIIITPSTSSQTVVVPSGYDGVSDVRINAIQIDSTHNTATGNGTFSPTSGQFFSSFVVNVPVYDGSSV